MASAIPSDLFQMPILRDDPQIGVAAAKLLWLASHATTEAAYLKDALALVAEAAGGQTAVLVAGIDGQWTPVGPWDASLRLPVGLLADALDRNATEIGDGWVAIPMAGPAESAEALLFQCRPTTLPAKAAGWLNLLSPVLAAGLQTVRAAHESRRRIRRLETILDIAQQWNRTRELEPLLNQMAEAATKLLNADRASIFLWDRRAHTLVGRPALGIEGGELRIPDNRGVVGVVIQTGQPCRVNANASPDAIDRQVDQQLGYKTETLLCVPLRGKSGELFGAFELINKRTGPFARDDETALIELAAHAAIALENTRDREQLLSTSRQMTNQAAEQVRLVGESPSMVALRSIVRRVAETELAVLILGENGTGKEVVAQSIHYLSQRREKPFVAVNCAAIPETLAESELFGHEKGAFTDAQNARQGKFELAASGTLFLDEIGDLSLGGQAKLLRVLEEHVLVRVGGSTPIPTDARLVAATNQNLADMVRQKRFREDLYFRLNVVTIEIPPLRDRRNDILLLAEHFLRDFAAKARRNMPRFTPQAEERILNHSWPGNVRELRNLMERLAYLSLGDTIDVDELAFILSPRGNAAVVTELDQTLADATDQFQVEYIRHAIEHANGNMSQTAEQLGLHRSNLYRKMRQLKMPVPS
jgi:Nif-specific regulatory protein